MGVLPRRELPGFEIEPGLHTIGPLSDGVRQGGYSRAYLVEDGDRLTLVDTLFDDDAYMIIEYLLRIGRSAHELTDIVLTHAHRSHLGGLARLKKLSGATVWAHDREARHHRGPCVGQARLAAAAAPVRLDAVPRAVLPAPPAARPLRGRPPAERRRHTSAR